MNKFEIARDALRSIPGDNHSVLDVGCRDCIFSKYAPSGWRYAGLDLFQNERGAVTYVQSVEDGIPAEDRAFTAVVALDVVEHVDRMSQVMDELWRVTDRKLIVALPNMAFALYRLQFLRSGDLGDKYRILPYGSDDGDRHRWVTTAKDAIRYMEDFVAAHAGQARLSWRATTESGKRKLFEGVFRRLGVSPNFYAATLVFIIERS